jgi:hypothetical protein
MTGETQSMSVPPKRSHEGVGSQNAHEANCFGRISDLNGSGSDVSCEIASNPLLRVHRVCQVPLLTPARNQGTEPRRAACLAANFGNHLLTEWYAKSKGVQDLNPYTDYRALLSAAVRDAVGL